jgi:D-arabinose 1-dehydrogenase-like Zn-dependent alcohol dehydrogenase
MLGVPLTYLRNLFDFNKKVIFYLIGQKRFGGYESIKNDYKILLELFKNKKIDPLVEILPFSEKNVQEAHQRLQNGEVLGKIVLIFDH